MNYIPQWDAWAIFQGSYVLTTRFYTAFGKKVCPEDPRNTWILCNGNYCQFFQDKVSCKMVTKLSILCIINYCKQDLISEKGGAKISFST